MGHGRPAARTSSKTHHVTTCKLFFAATSPALPLTIFSSPHHTLSLSPFYSHSPSLFLSLLLPPFFLTINETGSCVLTHSVQSLENTHTLSHQGSILSRNLAFLVYLHATITQPCQHTHTYKVAPPSHSYNTFHHQHSAKYRQWRHYGQVIEGVNHIKPGYTSRKECIVQYAFPFGQILVNKTGAQNVGVGQHTHTLTTSSRA